MIEYFIALRAQRLDDYGGIEHGEHRIRYTASGLVKTTWLVEDACKQLAGRYPASERWYGQQYSFDGLNWNDA